MRRKPPRTRAWSSAVEVDRADGGLAADGLRRKRDRLGYGRPGREIVAGVERAAHEPIALVEISSSIFERSDYAQWGDVN
jgi:hypothetical protein